MKVFILLSTLVCLSAATEDVRARFREAMDKYAFQDQINLSESPEVLKARLISFIEFDARVQEINADDSRLFTAEDNFLSILTPEEREGRLGLNITGHEVTEPTGPLSTLNAGDLPEHRDFSDVISDIKDQGGCGSCWTFGASSALEGEIYFKTGDRKVSLSEQEWLECSSRGDGCMGGWPEWCYKYSKLSGRVAPTKAYPYKESDNGCYPQAMQKKSNALADHNVRIVRDFRIAKGSLLKYASRHIVSVAIRANNDFMTYSNGVYMDDYCQKLPNHAVAVVGYGMKWGRPYWKVRNSWGTGWGNNGYILMDRQTYNMCSIEWYAHIPDVRCRDNTCVAPHPDEGDSGEGADTGTEEPPKICYKTLKLGYCRWSRQRALLDCTKSGIPENSCYIVRWNSICYKGSVESTESYSGSRIQFPVPCGDEKEDGSLCKKSYQLSWCRSSPEAALKGCSASGIPLPKCLFVESSKSCFVSIVANPKQATESSIEYYASCDDKDQDDDNTGECDANAGLVLCSDCNCCKHKHFCRD